MIRERAGRAGEEPRAGRAQRQRARLVERPRVQARAKRRRRKKRRLRLRLRLRRGVLDRDRVGVRPVASRVFRVFWVFFVRGGGDFGVLRDGDANAIEERVERGVDDGVRPLASTRARRSVSGRDAPETELLSQT